MLRGTHQEFSGWAWNMLPCLTNVWHGLWRSKYRERHALFRVFVDGGIVHRAVQSGYDRGVLGNDFAFDNDFLDGESADDMHNRPSPTPDQANPALFFL